MLKSKAAPVTDVDGKLIRLVDDMFTALDEPMLGIALAAPQIGVQKQVFVWELDERPMVVFNPEIVESRASGCTTKDACRSPACTSRWCARSRC